MKTVLFTWELGGGIGHVTSLSRFAARLRQHDVRPVAAVRNLESAQILREAGIEIFQAPRWPVEFLTNEQRASLSSATMNDLLVAIGVANEDALRALLQQWDGILKSFQPDLVVADYAPASCLMSRGRIPLLITGNGYTLPPSEMKRFPLIHRVYAPLWDEDETLSAVNRAMRSVGRLPLERLPEIFAADARFVETFPLFDPYDAQRLESANGPVFGSPPVGRQQGAHLVLVYLSRSYELRLDIVKALRPLASQLYIHAPRLTAEQSADLAQGGARIYQHPLPLREFLPLAGLVVHLGGSGLSAETLAAGVPQLVLATHIEQQLNATALENAGVGQMIKDFDPNSKVSPDMVEALLADEAMARRAMNLGEQHRNMLEAMKPIAAFEAAALELLNA
jgi:UDP:flavonoid glycosyltransferase YjiC (YdhE family)